MEWIERGQSLYRAGTPAAPARRPRGIAEGRGLRCGVTMGLREAVVTRVSPHPDLPTCASRRVGRVGAVLAVALVLTVANRSVLPNISN